jgi:hypothetical protein
MEEVIIPGRHDTGMTAASNEPIVNSNSILEQSK